MRGASERPRTRSPQRREGHPGGTVPQREEPTVSPLLTISRCPISLFPFCPSPSRPSLFACLFPPRPFGTPRFPHPRARLGRPQRSILQGPRPRAPARPAPARPLGSGPHPEEQVEAEQQVLDAAQAPAEAPHAAAGRRDPESPGRRWSARSSGSRREEAGLQGLEAWPAGRGRGLRGLPWAGPAGGGVWSPTGGARGPGRTPAVRLARGGGTVRPGRAPPPLSPERGTASYPPGAGRRAPRAPRHCGYLSICQEAAPTGDPRPLHQPLRRGSFEAAVLAGDPDAPRWLWKPGGRGR